MLLSPRELQVLALVADGCRNKEIAFRLHLQISTVKGRVSGMMRALSVNSRVELCLWAYGHRAVFRGEAVKLGSDKPEELVA